MLTLQLSNREHLRLEVFDVMVAGGRKEVFVSESIRDLLKGAVAALLSQI